MAGVQGILAGRSPQASLESLAGLELGIPLLRCGEYFDGAER
jgi:hypothetical protein